MQKVNIRLTLLITDMDGNANGNSNAYSELILRRQGIA